MTQTTFHADRIRMTRRERHFRIIIETLELSEKEQLAMMRARKWGCVVTAVYDDAGEIR